MTLAWTNHLSGYTQALHRKQKTMTNFVNYFSSWSRRWQYKEYSDSLINHFPAWPQTLKRKQNEITSSPIIYLADHELYNTNRKHWQSHGSSTSPTAPERICQIYCKFYRASNLTLMNIIEKKYYQFLDMQTLQHKQEKIIIQWINHLSTDPEHDKQSLGIYFILFR